MEHARSERSIIPVVLGGTPPTGSRWSDWPRPAGTELELLGKVIASGQWGFDGPMEAEFEREFALYQDANYGVCVANGTVALQLALESLGVGAGDEVIVPGLTWQATAAAALDINAVPVLADVEPSTYCIDPEAIESLVTDRTRAIIVVHLYSNLADLDRALEIGARHGIPVIEDCAHNHGGQWRGRGVGSWGVLGCFSFQLFKTLTAGEGGIVTTNDDVLRERVYSLRNCGRQRPGSDEAAWRPIQSGNYRMTELQAAVLLAQFSKLDAEVAERSRNVSRLDGELSRLDGVAALKARAERTRVSPYRYVFKYLADQWDGLSATAFRAALGAELGCPLDAPYEPLNAAPLYLPHTKRRYRFSEEHWRAVDPTRFDLPVASQASREAVVLPHSLLLDPAGVEAVSEAIRRLRRHLDGLRRWESELIVTT
jgi:L-glutamine:2-deoxy-scyllo-inosose/3-amino-2,3-dideoxy-scyllo-inosose aminotransferase